MLQEKFKELTDYIFNAQVPEYYSIYIAYNNVDLGQYFGHIFMKIF